MITFKLMMQESTVPYLQYHGVVPLVGGDTLAVLCGITSGSAINNAGGFLKFTRNGKELYLARQCFRRSISWNQLASANSINGSKEVSISGSRYKVMLPSGGISDPSTAPGGDWDELMYAVCEDRPVTYTGPVLANLTSDYLFVGNGSTPRSTLCRETHSNSASNCVRRGRDNLPYYAALPKSDNGTLVFWRPLLELVE